MRPMLRLVAVVAAAAACSSFAWAQASDKPAGTAKAEIGQAAPSFELTGVDGKVYKLSDYADKVVVLEWFNKDCPFCKKAVPQMISTQKKFAEKGVVWLAIDSTNNRTSKDNLDFASSEKIVYPILMDTDGKVGKSYGAATTPHMFIINKGKLVYMGAHDDKKDRNYVDESLTAVLAGKEVPVATTKSYGCSVKYKN